uniref:Hemagglutinin n=1 Tax=Strongyloides venezuelensis TaxID=75913 RepID=A0A0K0F4T7_STRVS
MKEKSSTMKKKVGNTRAVINDVGKQLTALRGIFDRELTSQHCYTIDERSKILIRDSEKLNVPFTSNEWDRITGRNEGNKTDNELWTKNDPLGRKMHVL